MVIPIVLIAGVLLLGMVLSMQFVSTSDYRRVARLMRDMQAVAIADVAADELHVQLGQISYGAGSSRPAWLTKLLGDLDAAVQSAAPDATEFTVNVPIKKSDLPTPKSDAIAQKVSNLVKIKNIEGKVGPKFRVVRGGLQSNDYYRERAPAPGTPPGANPAPPAGAPPVTPWDLVGDLNVAITLAGDGPLRFDETYIRGQELHLLDTTPPADEFTVFAFEPALDADYAVQDMNGARLTLMTEGGGPATRIMVQGPLILAPENPPYDPPPNPAPPTGFGGVPYLSPHEKAPLPAGGSTASRSYPDGTWVGGLATVPGPDTLHHRHLSRASDNIGQTAGRIEIETGMGDTEARRSAFKSSHSKFITKASPPIQVTVGPNNPFTDGVFSWSDVGKLDDLVDALGVDASSLGGLKDISFGTVVTAITGGFDAVVREECTKQRDVPINLPKLKLDLPNLSLVLAKDLAGGGDQITYESVDDSEASYYPPAAYFYAPVKPDKQSLDVKRSMPATSTSNAPSGGYKGVSVPVTGDGGLATAVQQTNEGDGYTLEPVPRVNNSEIENRGVFGVYGIARFESRTLVKTPIKLLFRWLNDTYIDYMDGRTMIVPFCKPEKTVEQMFKDAAPQAIQSVLDQLGLNGDVQFLIRRYDHEGGLDLGDNPAGLTRSILEDSLSNHKAAVVPYGSYVHKDAFWTAGPGQDMKDEVMNRLLQPSAHQPVPANASDIPSDVRTVLDKLLLGNPKPPENSGITKGTGWTTTPDFTNVPGADVLADGYGQTLREWLVDTYATRFLRFAVKSPSGDHRSVVGRMLDEIRTLGTSNSDGSGRIPFGISPITTVTEKRPDGAFGSYRTTPQPANSQLAKIRELFPNRGFFPPRYREFDRIATRSYPTLDAFVDAETKQGVVDLRGAVFIRSCKSQRSFKYRGRGIVIVITPDKDNVAEVTGQIEAEDRTKDLLIFVHRVDPALINGTQVKSLALKLGPKFEGSLYSDTGVAPSGSSTVIVGNLVCALLNLRGATGKSIEVHYNPAFTQNPPPMKDRWTVDMIGEVTSVQPGT